MVYAGTQKDFPVRSAPIISDKWKIYVNGSLVYTGKVYNYTIGITTVNSTRSNSRIPCGPDMCDRIYLGNTPVPTVIAVTPSPAITIDPINTPIPIVTTNNLTPEQIASNAPMSNYQRGSSFTANGCAANNPTCGLKKHLFRQ
jgi:hypothetical protein